jgi:hypothetical protein
VPENWKTTSADKAASWLRMNVKVEARIRDLVARWAEEGTDNLQITTTDVLRQLWEASCFDPAEVYHWYWRPNASGRRSPGQHGASQLGPGGPGKMICRVKDLLDIPLRARRQIKSVRFDGYNVHLTFHDPSSARRLVGEHLGMWQGESQNAPVVVDNSQHVTFVDTARHETPEQWQERVQKRLAEVSKVVNGGD